MAALAFSFSFFFLFYFIAFMHRANDEVSDLTNELNENCYWIIAVY
jgi:hypothetical protein